MSAIYDPSKYIFSAGDVPCLGGYGADSFIRISFQNDLAGVKKGLDGEAQFFISRDDSAIITITLLATADYNGYLTSQFYLQRARLSTPELLPIHIEDLGGRLVASSAEALIQKPPEKTVDKEGADLEWNFICGKLDISYYGGGVTSLPDGVRI